MMTAAVRTAGTVGRPASSGVVTTDDGDPLSGARVTVASGGTASTRLARTTRDATSSPGWSAATTRSVARVVRRRVRTAGQTARPLVARAPAAVAETAAVATDRAAEPRDA